VVSIATVWRWLKRLGIRWMRVAPNAPNRWPKSRVLRWVRELEQVAQECRPDEVVVFVDETELHLNRKLGFDWCLRGFRRWLRTPGDNRELHLGDRGDALRIALWLRRLGLASGAGRWQTGRHRGRIEARNSGRS